MQSIKETLIIALGVIDWLILTACQPVYNILGIEVWESSSLYIQIYIFCVVVTKEGFFFLQMALSNTNDFLNRSIWATDVTWVELKVMEMKVYSTLLKSSELEPHNQI